eukprot:298641-Alexandrium_andersonii.AAC.1
MSPRLAIVLPSPAHRRLAACRGAPQPGPPCSPAPPVDRRPPTMSLRSSRSLAACRGALPLVLACPSRPRSGAPARLGGG